MTIVLASRGSATPVIVDVAPRHTNARSSRTVTWNEPLDKATTSIVRWLLSGGGSVAFQVPVKSTGWTGAGAGIDAIGTSEFVSLPDCRDPEIQTAGLPSDIPPIRKRDPQATAPYACATFNRSALGTRAHDRPFGDVQMTICWAEHGYHSH